MNKTQQLPCQSKEYEQQTDHLNMTDLYHLNANKIHEREDLKIGGDCQDKNEDKIGQEETDEKEEVNERIKLSQLLPASNTDIRQKKGQAQGITFSKFQIISQPSQQVFEDTSRKPELKSTLPMNSNIKQPRAQNQRIPTSSKQITSKTLIQNPPVQVISFHPHQYDIPQNVNSRASKHDYTFQYCHISHKELLDRFASFAKQKSMQIKIGEHTAIAMRRVPIYKSAISLCFPSAENEHQVYELHCVGQQNASERTAKLNQTSGDDKKYYEFRQEFLVQLWLDKYLIYGSLHQNIRHFIRHVNSPKFTEKICKINKVSAQNKKSKQINQLDQIKLYIDKVIKSYSTSLKPISNPKKQPKPDQMAQKSSTEDTIKTQYINTPQLLQMKNIIRQMQQNLKKYLQIQLRKEHQLRKAKVNNKTSEKDIVEGEHHHEVDGDGDGRSFVTPSVERMLLTILYHHLNLDQVVKKYIVNTKDIGDFEKKKMIIKGSLNNADIFRYLQLQQFYTQHMAQLPQPDKSHLFPTSTKLLTSLTPTSHPSPSQILQVLSIFRTTLQKQIDSYSTTTTSTTTNNRVKLQDHNNHQRIFFQFCIYCVIMCENRDLLAMLEVGLVFCEAEEKVRVYYAEALGMGVVVRRAIWFVRDQWEL